MSKPRFLISQLAHVEFLSARPAETVEFLIGILGMTETDRDGASVYLRGWGDWFKNTLIVTEGPETALGHIAWRTTGPDELDKAVRRLEAAGVAEGWVEDSVGHGPAHRFRSPGGGQLSEVLWEVERYGAPPELRSSMPNRPQRFAPHGVGVRQLDHTTCGAPSPIAVAEWYRDTLGFRFTEYVKDGDREIMAMVTNNEKSHELGIVPDHSGIQGRTHHFAYWVDDPGDIWRAADILLESGCPIEYGPTRHGMGENACLYFREPGGMRIELFSGGYRNYLPDWEPVAWTADGGGLNMFRNYEWRTARDLFPQAPTFENGAGAAPADPAVEHTGAGFKQF
jgi:catechol 2,3-dioxygenase